jgi:hypothetical protein
MKCPDRDIDWFLNQLATQVKTVKTSISSQDRRLYVQSLQTGSLVGTCNGA